MNLYIFSSLIPLSASFFIKNEKLARGLQLLSAVTAIAAVIVSEALKPDIPTLLPTLTVLLIYFIEKFKDRNFDVYEWLGILMVGQALLLAKNSDVLALCLATDILFAFTQRNSKKYFFMAVAWLPLICGRLINDRGELFDVLLAMTIILRSFDWPIKAVPTVNGSKVQEFISRVAIPIALWKSAEMSMMSFWVGFWMSMPLFFAWGTSSRVVLALTTLSLWTVSPQWGLVSVAVWPAFFLEGVWALVFGLAVIFSGTLANIQALGLQEEIRWALIGLEAFVVSRVVASLFVEKKKQNPKEAAGLTVLALAVLGGALSFINLLEIQWQMEGYVFAGLAMLLSLAGYFLSQKKKGLFVELRGWEPLERLTAGVEKARFYNFKITPQTTFYESSWMAKVFEAIESEGYIIVLLALVAGFFLWSSP